MRKGDFAMRNGFMKGVMVGGIVAASVGFMMNTDMISGRTKRKMIRGGRNLLRKTGHIMNEVSEMFR
jgi:gas vesicle protein